MYRIKQLKDNEFIIQKSNEVKNTKGFLWWKKETTIIEWSRVDEYGNSCVYFYGSPVNLPHDTIKNIDDAKKMIDDFNKYPKIINS